MSQTIRPTPKDDRNQYNIQDCILHSLNKTHVVKKNLKVEEPGKSGITYEIALLKNAVLNTSIVGITIKMKTRITAGARHANTKRFCAFFLFMSFSSHLLKSDEQQFAHRFQFNYSVTALFLDNLTQASANLLW